MVLFLTVDRRTRWVLLAYRLPREPSTPRISLRLPPITNGRPPRPTADISLRTDRDLIALRKELEQLVERLNALREREPRALSPELLEKVRERVRRGDYAYENDPLWEAAPGRATTSMSETALEPSVEGSQDPVGPPDEGPVGGPPTR